MVPFLGGARCVAAYVPYSMVYGPVHIAPLLGRGTHHMGPASVGWYVIYVMFINSHNLVKKKTHPFTTSLTVYRNTDQPDFRQVKSRFFSRRHVGDLPSCPRSAECSIRFVSLCISCGTDVHVFNVHCHALENGPKYCKLSLLLFQVGLEEHGAPANIRELLEQRSVMCLHDLSSIHS